MKFKLTKKIFYFFLITTVISCSSDDDTSDIITPVENGLILKRITSNRSDVKIEFNTSGRFISSIANENSLNESSIENTINDLNQRIIRRARTGLLNEIIEYKYDSSEQITETKTIKTDEFLSEITLITTFEYMDNQIIGTNSENNEDFQFIFTFSDNSYEELKNFKATNVSSGEVVFEESYSYYSDGNFKNTTIIQNNSLPQSDAILLTYEYDNNINPWAKGNRIDYLNDILGNASKNTGSLVSILVNFSKNNRKTSFVKNSTLTLEYNDQNYIIKETDARNNPDFPDSDAIRFFEYY